MCESTLYERFIPLVIIICLFSWKLRTEANLTADFVCAAFKGTIQLKSEYALKYANFLLLCRK